MKYLLYFSILIFFVLGCSTSKKKESKEKTSNVLTEEKREVTSEKSSARKITAEIVAKKFHDKRGVQKDFDEYYIRMSVQDYFIKFCESNITRLDVEELLKNNDNLIKTFTMEVDFRNGEWDLCEEDIPAQSRIGEYAVILKIY